MAHRQTQTEWEEEMSVKILDFVRNELYLELRFLDVALSALTPKAQSALSTMATDGRYLYYSTEQILRVFQNNAKYLDRCFLHVVLHCIFFHPWMRGEREEKLWNLACDVAVEYTIDAMGKDCTKRILSYQRQKCYEELNAAKRGISAAVIYRLLKEKEPEEIEKLVYEFYTDDHRYWAKNGEEKSPESQILQKNWNKIARQTKMERESRGDEQKDGEELFAAQIKAERSRRSYREFLKKFSVLREEMHADPDEFDLNYYTYGLRFYGNMPLVEPVESREAKKIQEFVVVVDTSYSTSGELVKQFLKETFGILTQENSFFKDCRIRIIQCDEKVRMDEEVQSVQALEALLERFSIVGGGGTDFRPAFEYVNGLLEEGVFRNLCGLLYFTDGKGIYPKKKPPYRTAFLFLEDYEESAVPPWAIRLKLEPEEFEVGSKK